MLTYIKRQGMHEGKFLFTILMMFLITFSTGKTENNPIVISTSRETSSAKEAMEVSSLRLVHLLLFGTMKVQQA